MDPYGVWLTCRIGSATVKTSALLQHLGGAEQIYRSSAADRAPFDLTEADNRALDDKSMNDVNRIISRCGQLGINLLHSWEEDYPPLLRQIANPPFTLFYRGEIGIVSSSLTIAIVGTRSCTRYGAGVAEQFAGELAGCGIVVVSGLADGIDASANLGALKGGGRTVAVLGNSVDKAYPSHNAYLMDQILETGGLVLSEYAPGSRVFRSNFPARNRIISGLSYGTLVVEAPLRSGALITASLALEQNRDLFAVPGNITSFASEGANQLLKDNCAKPVTCTLDILEEYLSSHAQFIRTELSLQPAAAPRPRRERAVPEPLPVLRRDAVPHKEQAGNRARFELELTAEEAKLLELLQEGDLSTDRLITGSGLPTGKVIATLTMLEAKGRIRAIPGGRFTLTHTLS